MLVHWTGNLQIAASVFITLGMLLVLVLLAARAVNGSRSTTPTTITTTQKDEVPTAQEPVPPPGKSRQRSRLPGILVVAVQCSLYIGALLQIFAQFFGILGLTINATPTPSEAGANSIDGIGATPWIMDKAMTRYATVAWTMAIGCIFVMTYGYRALT